MRALRMLTECAGGHHVLRVSVAFDDTQPTHHRLSEGFILTQPNFASHFAALVLADSTSSILISSKPSPTLTHARTYQPAVSSSHTTSPSSRR